MTNNIHSLGKLRAELLREADEPRLRRAVSAVERYKVLYTSSHVNLTSGKKKKRRMRIRNEEKQYPIVDIDPIHSIVLHPRGHRVLRGHRVEPRRRWCLGRPEHNDDQRDAGSVVLGQVRRSLAFCQLLPVLSLIGRA